MLPSFASAENARSVHLRTTTATPSVHPDRQHSRCMGVPNRYLLVWMGRTFPYHCRLAVESIATADPSATIEIHVLGDVPTGEDFAEVASMGSVAIHAIELDRLFSTLPNAAELRTAFDEIPSYAASARSNLLRYALLYERGGVYVDFDVIVRRPLHGLGNGAAFVGEERVWRHDRARVEGRRHLGMAITTVVWAFVWTMVRADCRWFAGRLRLSRRLERLAPLWSTDQPNNAILGAPPYSPFVGALLGHALSASPSVRYALGPSLVADVVAHYPETVTVLDRNAFYFVPPSESTRFFEDSTVDLPADAAAIHYVASNHTGLLRSLTKDDPRFESERAPFWSLGRSVRSACDATPLVSCLMVTRNRRDLARRAVECFASQTWTHRELVIIDDGDEDYTGMLAPFLEAGHRIVYERRLADPRVLLGALRNHAIERSTGAWCIQWDDDEWYHPDRIAVQMGAVAGDATAVALRWTLMSVEPDGRAPLAFRSDTGIATPGTVLHRRDAARYPNLARGEDSVFLRRLRDAGELVVLGKEHAYLFVRCFHGSNTWSESHFVARLHRRPADWPAYATARWWHRDLTRHPACELSPREVATIATARAGIAPSRASRAVA